MPADFQFNHANLHHILVLKRPNNDYKLRFHLALWVMSICVCKPVLTDGPDELARFTTENSAFRQVRRKRPGNTP